MREVDQALARAYARRTTSAHPSVPPSPHVAPRVSEPVVFQWPAMVLTLEREFSERFDRLARALVDTRKRRNLNLLLFTSCHRAEGRTTLALTLARALARTSLRIVLVDADLNGPMLARQLGLKLAVGLDDVVEEGRALADALIDSAVDHLAILPLRAAVSNPRGFLASPLWKLTMARLRRDFDLVLLDGGPMFAGLSHALLPGSLDAAILVHNRKLTSRNDLQRARKVLEAVGIPLLGLAETFSG